MEEFRVAFNDCHLEDVGYEGHWFTWEMGNLSKTNIKECLNRRVENLEGTMVEWLAMLGKGLQSWGVKIKNQGKEASRQLFEKLEEIDEKETTDENLADLIDTKIQLNVEGTYHLIPGKVYGPLGDCLRKGFVGVWDQVTKVRFGQMRGYQLTNCWKEDVIKNTLCAKDADRILCIPLPVDRQDDKKLLVQRIETECWRPSETSHVKVNFDVAFSQQHKELCSGIVTRNEEGQILKAKAILFGAENCFLTVEIEGDALSVINNLQKDFKDSTAMGCNGGLSSKNKHLVEYCGKGDFLMIKIRRKIQTHSRDHQEMELNGDVGREIIKDASSIGFLEPSVCSRTLEILAHPGGPLTTNKAAAFAKFLERKLQDPNGVSSINPQLLELAVNNAKATIFQ
ncbi:hypothetical protein Gotri_002793, partial [Gossypium trilobum]|nr:hypothetical protein [Gossypium trilobum]